MAMKREYMTFYFDGRDDELDDDDLDIEDLAEKALAGPDDLHTVLAKAVAAVAAPLSHDREKREWIEDNRDAIKDAGGDAEEAYRHYCKGREDETIYQLEPEVLEAMMPEDDDDEEEEEEEEES